MPLLSDFKSKDNVANSFCKFFSRAQPTVFGVTSLYKIMLKKFPDSKIAENFACGRTKSTQMIKRAISPCLDEEVILAC